MNTPQPNPGARLALQARVDREVLTSEVQAWARRIGVDALLHEIHVRPMANKWASISSRGRLTLNSALFAQTSAFRREVIVHELVHLKMGHGRHNGFFQALVQAYLEEGAHLLEEP